MRTRSLIAVPIVLAFAFALSCLLPDGPNGSAGDPPRPQPFGDRFWQLWGDGRAEISTYDLSFPRYGVPRRGTAVAIYVTESFDDDARVKSDRSGPSDSIYPVMKLNLVQDFPTGIYDYNLMTSVFVALREIHGRPAGWPVKISFSSQEWCGQVYEQALFDERRVRLDSHSYFGGEADARLEPERPAQDFAEDALPLWARGLAGPRLDPGESVELRLLRSLQTARLLHREAEWLEARLQRAAEPESLEVPAGRFETERFDATLRETDAGTTRWTFHVELGAARRIIRWSRSDGIEADLVGSRRLKYWEMNGAGFDRAVEQIGLTPRPPLTP